MTVRIDAELLIPGRGDPIENGTVLLDGSTIVFAGTTSALPGSVGRADESVKVVMPGMWDCHAHFGTPTASELADRTSFPSAAAMGARAVDELSRTLDAGVTSVREVGGAGIELVKEIEAERIRSPHLYGAGGIMSPTAGHADRHAIPLEALNALGDRGEFMHNVADGVPQVLKAVRRNLRRNARVIKICTSGGVMSEVDHWSHQQFSDAEITAIVQEAARADRVVAAHAEGKAGIMAALRCGVRTIEHGDETDEEVVEMMLEKDIVLVPTLWVTRQLMAMPDEMPDFAYRKLSELAEIQDAGLALAVEAGVRIAMGTDIFVHGSLYGTNSREIRHLVEVGMSPLAAIEAATANGPATLGPQAPRSGQLREGYDADVIALDFNPLTELASWGDPAHTTHVWKAGHLVKQPA
ncbi:MAG: amidohydrolase family protein [Actinomycetia bacterium]|nr:amidohydrolase family protein [Actinomycetes bacterium]